MSDQFFRPPFHFEAKNLPLTAYLTARLPSSLLLSTFLPHLSARSMSMSLLYSLLPHPPCFVLRDLLITQSSSTRWLPKYDPLICFLLYYVRRDLQLGCFPMDCCVKIISHSVSFQSNTFLSPPPLVPTTEVYSLGPQKVSPYFPCPLILNNAWLRGKFSLFIPFEKPSPFVTASTRSSYFHTDSHSPSPLIPSLMRCGLPGRVPY